jgi:HNH endonuclease
MFDNIEGPGSIFAAVLPPSDVAASPAEPNRVPLERLEAQICELAGHLAAATCRFLVLLGDFDARRGWASWEMTSCAQWLSGKCQMSSGTAREHVRVARALRDLPVIRARFAAARLSYAKVRALTRIATPQNEAGLAEIAGPMTGNQLERFARAHRQVTQADDANARVRRRLVWRFEEDGSLSGTFRLPPLQGAVLLKALRAACDDLAGTAGDPRGDVSAETPSRVPGDPADPARCHVEDGPAISVSTAQMLSCTAALSWMRHDRGAVLALGRRRRRPSAAIRRAARERDKCRCRFPGCESRRVDLHHIQHWINGGRTDLENLVSLCPYHHKLVHDRGYLIAAPPGGGDTFAFYRPDGARLPSCPPLPEPDGPIDRVNDADITPETIVPPWYGERLDLDHAIWVCFANARTEEQKRADREQASEPLFRPHTWVSDFNDMDWVTKVGTNESWADRSTGSSTCSGARRRIPRGGA